jgi:hypothetical protein
MLLLALLLSSAAAISAKTRFLSSTVRPSNASAISPMTACSSCTNVRVDGFLVVVFFGGLVLVLAVGLRVGAAVASALFPLLRWQKPSPKTPASGVSQKLGNFPSRLNSSRCVGIASTLSSGCCYSRVSVMVVETRREEDACELENGQEDLQ